MKPIKKKILLINSYIDHNYPIGGTEVYAKYLVNILHKYYDIDEAAVKRGNDDDKLTNIIDMKNVWGNKSEVKKKYDDIIKNNKYEFIISSTYGINNVKLNYYGDKVIYIQHLNPFYLWLMSFNNNCPLMNKKIKYVVAYDEVDKKIMRFFFGFKKKYFAAPLPVDSPLVKKVNKPQNFIIMSGRLHSGQKNVNFLLKMSKYLDCKIKLYGPSYPQQIEHFKKFKNVEYYGPFTHKDLTNMYKNANASILVSKFEGFGFVLAESLQNSTPIIVRNTFPASKWLVNKKQNGLLLNRFLTPYLAAKKVNKFLKNMKYKEITDNCYKFAKDNLSMNNFEKKWLDVIKTVVNDK